MVGKLKRNDRCTIKILLSIAIFILGIIAAIYCGFWLMFIKPIIVACAVLNAGILTTSLVFITVLKCIFASTVGGLIFAVSNLISKSLRQ